MLRLVLGVVQLRRMLLLWLVRRLVRRLGRLLSLDMGKLLLRVPLVVRVGGVGGVLLGLGVLTVVLELRRRWLRLSLRMVVLLLRVRQMVLLRRNLLVRGGARPLDIDLWERTGMLRGLWFRCSAQVMQWRNPLVLLGGSVHERDCGRGANGRREDVRRSRIRRES